jgi:AcrR family transcriptional regulator
MEVFWRKGYEGASLTELTKAMGINRPSLYAAFGDKEALFRRVLDRYGEGPTAYLAESLRQPTARAVAEAMLQGTAAALGNPLNPRGCLVVHGALACGDEAGPIRQELIRRRTAAGNALRRRFRRAQSAGDLSKNLDAAALAQYIMAVTHGMAVQAASGTSRAQLRKVAEMAMKAWPK